MRLQPKGVRDQRTKSAERRDKGVLAEPLPHVDIQRRPVVMQLLLLPREIRLNRHSDDAVNHNDRESDEAWLHSSRYEKQT